MFGIRGLARFTIYLAAVIAVAGVSSMATAVQAATGALQTGAYREVSPLPVLAHRAEIDFGEEIELHAEVDIRGIQTVEAKAIYRPIGPSRISAYAYADVQVSPAKDKLDLKFTIPTGGTKYYPPGTEFDIHFELLDSEGVIHSTRPFKVEYLDPRITWRRVSNGPVTAIYNGISDDQARDLVDHAVSVLPVIATTVGVEEPPSIKAVLFDSVRQATPYFPPVSKTATDRQFFAGFAMSEYGLFVMAAPSRGIFVHEMTHLVVAEAEKSPLGRDAPSWLNEGLAVYFQNEGDHRQLERRLAGPARQGKLIPIKHMNRIPGRRDQINVFYPQSGHFVAYLIARYGHERVASLLGNLDAGQEIAGAFHSAYGESLYDVENDWRSTLGAGPLPTPDPALLQLPPPAITQVPLLKPPVDTVKSPETELEGEGEAPPRPGPTTVPAPTAAPPQDESNYGTPDDALGGGTSGRVVTIVIVAIALVALAVASGTFVLAKIRSRREVT